MLFEMAIADAYAIAYEFVKDIDWLEHRINLSIFRQNPKYPTLKIGHYTDDTQRAIANARVVLYGNPFDPNSYVKEYIKTYRRDPRDCYSRRYQSLLNETVAYSEDDDIAARYFNGNCRRQAVSNGSIMGIAPLGYIKRPEQVAMAAAVQALSTHGSETIPYAQALALKAHANIYEPFQPDYYDFISQRHIYTQGIADYRMGPIENIDMSARSTYQAVMRLLERDQSHLSLLITDAIQMGGDTDSVAAIAVSIKSVLPHTKNDFMDKGLVEGFAEKVSSKSELVGIDLALREYRNK